MRVRLTCDWPEEGRAAGDVIDIPGLRGHQLVTEGKAVPARDAELTVKADPGPVQNKAEPAVPANKSRRGRSGWGRP